MASKARTVESNNVVPDEVFAGFLVPISSSGLASLPSGDVYVCACGNLIYPSGRAGRPAKTCESCRNATDARRKAARVRTCISCKRFLPKPKGRGRPAHRCPACLAKDIEWQGFMNEVKMEDAIDRGYCDPRCMYAHEEECRCYCEGAFHMAGWSGLGSVPDHDQH